MHNYVNLYFINMISESRFNDRCH